jgi:hypothetical protein
MNLNTCKANIAILNNNPLSDRETRDRMKEFYT